NLVQNSWNMEFFNDAPFNTFDPTVPGRYDFYLAAFEDGVEVVRGEMVMIVTNGASLILEAAACQRDQDCDLPGVQIEIDLYQRNLGTNATGFQGFFSFDDSVLTYEGLASSYSASPYSVHIQNIATAEVAAGELRLDGSASFGGSGDDADSLLATLVFTVASECTPVSLAFDLGQGFDSELSFQGAPIVTTILNSPTIIADDTAPIISTLPDIMVTADASVNGGCDSAVVTFPLPAASDTCSSVVVACFPPSGTAFPAGETTTVTCTATDECGNVALTTFDVTVSNTNLVFADIQLVGVTTSITRCIHFVAGTCNVVADAQVTFDNTGFFSGFIEIPCGAWTKLCAKDEQHTMWDNTPLVLSMDGTYYIATTQLDLQGGDTDNDGDVDINDVTWFMFQFGALAAPGGCPWDGVTRDADFSNDGAVGTEDYTFLTANWLSASECLCTAPFLAGDRGDPRDNFDLLRPSTRRASQLVTRNWHSKVDFDKNGRLDYRDVRKFEQRHGLGKGLSDKLRAETPRRRR
ncbi:hypothetical protein DRQ53_15895, partial [bacterium]